MGDLVRVHQRRVGIGLRGRRPGNPAHEPAQPLFSRRAITDDRDSNHRKPPRVGLASAPLGSRGAPDFRDGADGHRAARKLGHGWQFHRARLTWAPRPHSHGRKTTTCGVNLSEKTPKLKLRSSRHLAVAHRPWRTRRLRVGSVGRTIPMKQDEVMITGRLTCLAVTGVIALGLVGCGKASRQECTQAALNVQNLRWQAEIAARVAELPVERQAATQAELEKLWPTRRAQLLEEAGPFIDDCADKAHPDGVNCLIAATSSADVAACTP